MGLILLIFLILFLVLRGKSAFSSNPVSHNFLRDTGIPLKTIPIIRDFGKQIDVVGESFHEKEFRRMWGQKSQWGRIQIINATLFPVNDNPHDKNAVEVILKGAYRVGYLTKKDAEHYRGQIGELPVRCKADVTGGWKTARSEGCYSVALYLDLQNLKKNYDIAREAIRPKSKTKGTHKSEEPLL